jgi:RNA polymerase sigma factor (sigma-70 family)
VDEDPMGATDMAAGNHGALARGIDRIFNQGSLTGLTEGQLLRRFATGDEGAFEALIARHGAMVLGVCRRLLYESSDVEDAFQATFLVLLRKAGTLRDSEPLGPWLHGVAYRVAARIRGRSARRPEGERRGARPEAVESACGLERSELRLLIDEEIGRLPEKYRRPVVLCYLEGWTHEEAARRLRCSTGSLRGRLDRARETLRGRLIRRGVAPAAGLAVLAAGGEAVGAAVPASIVAATVATLARSATASAISSSAAMEMADGVFRAMVAARLRTAASFAMAGAIVLASGLAWLAVLGYSLARDGREQAPVAQAGGAAAGEGEGPSVEIRVVDHRDGRPLPGVALTVNADRQAGARATTDGAGRAAVALPDPLPKILSVVVRKEGFAPVTLWFPSPVREAEIPASYTLKLFPAEAVGGVVRDEQGRPVAGVRVAPTIWTSSADVRPLREDYEEAPPATTDEMGRWRCEGMPAGIDASRVSIAFTHPEYQRLDWPVGQALENLRSGRPAVLAQGLEVTGRVVDPAGRPVADARIVLGRELYTPDVRRAETDKDGRFRFDHVAAGDTVVTIQAMGFAPALEKVVVRAGLEPMAVRLAKGRMVRGRVVDAKGEPIRGAAVAADGWRGHRTLEHQITTDEDGEFRWDDAPPDSFWVDVSHEGYLAVNRREVPPDAGDLSFVLIKPLKVRGTVVDAGTRHAVRDFTVVPGMESEGSFSTYWDRSQARPARGGRYEIVFDDMNREQGRRIRIEADGYKPSVSRVIRDDEDNPVVNFVLEKGQGVEGVVRGPDGSPMAGAEVVLVTPSQPAFLINGRLQQPNRDHPVIKTDARGRFTFQPREPPYTIVALGDQGFAEQTFREADAKPAELTARPWGRVEGTLRIGNRPGAGETLELGYRKQGDTPATLPWWSGSVKVDESGRFAFERVMPGEVTVSRRVLLKDSGNSQTWGADHGTLVDVRPGDTARANLGGTGRPVVGKLAAPAGFPGPIDWMFSFNHLRPTETAARKLLSVAGLSRGPRRAPGGVTVKLEADGSFRIEDVEAGTYELFFRINDPPRDPHQVGFGRDLLATARREVVVPEMPGGRSDEPLDLGSIVVEVAKKPAAAPGEKKKP